MMVAAIYKIMIPNYLNLKEIFFKNIGIYIYIAFYHFEIEMFLCQEKQNGALEYRCSNRW